MRRHFLQHGSVPASAVRAGRPETGRQCHSILKLKVEMAQLSVELAKTGGKLRLIQPEADLRVKTAIADLELQRLHDIKDQIENCTIKAPKDGVVILYQNYGRTGGGSLHLIVAQGEPVRESQKLLQMPDLNNMVVKVRVPQPLVTYLHSENKDKSKWQAAMIKVDAFPKIVLKGHVKFVNPVANTGWGTTWWDGTEVPIYTTLVAIDNDKNPNMPRLLPGMSAEVTIENVARKTGVVRVPVKAVVRTGQGHHCYVKVGKDIQKRDVMPGLRSDQFVEIMSGVQEGEAVLRDVEDLLWRFIQSKEL
jgi:HlyD family secretion protein